MYIFTRHIFWSLLLISSITVAEAQTLQFVFSSFPPFEYKEEPSQKTVGTNIQIITEVCRRLGVTPEFRQYPWKRALGYAKHGRTDAIFSLFKTDEREEYLSYPVEHLSTVKMVAIVPKSSLLAIRQATDFKELVVGVYRGSSYGPAFDSYSWIVREASNTYEELLQKMLLGRLDVVVMDGRVANYWGRKLGIKDQFRILDYEVYTNPAYVAFSRAKAARTGEDWAHRFSTTLKQMKAEGSVVHLIK